MQAVNSKGTGKSAGTKRAIDGSGSESPSKYQKTKATTVEDAVMPEEVKEPVETRAGDPDQVFRFMDLPGGRSLPHISELGCTDCSQNFEIAYMGWQ